jgi:hypothetical protein
MDGNPTDEFTRNRFMGNLRTYCFFGQLLNDSLVRLSPWLGLPGTATPYPDVTTRCHSRSTPCRYSIGALRPGPTYRAVHRSCYRRIRYHAVHTATPHHDRQPCVQPIDTASANLTWTWQQAEWSEGAWTVPTHDGPSCSGCVDVRPRSVSAALSSIPQSVALAPHRVVAHALDVTRRCGACKQHAPHPQPT